MSKTSLDDLRHLLAAEKTAIITGAYALLPELVMQKLAIIDQVRQTTPHMHDLQEIADQLAQNQRLFLAAMKGIRAARDRIETLCKVRNGLQVYDANGRFEAPLVQRPDFVKRA